MGLKGKDKVFVEQYLITLEPKTAALAAGFSENIAIGKAYQWVSDRQRKPLVYDAVQKGMARKAKKAEITQDMVVAELAKIGFGDIRNAVSWGSVPETNLDGERIYPVELVASEDMDADTAAAISEVSLTAQGVKIKMYDKKAALDSLGKHLGMFTDKVELSGNPDNPIVHSITRKVVDPKADGTND